MSLLWAVAEAGWTVGAAGGWVGKGAFIAVFVLLILMLVLLPGHLTGDGDGGSGWWRKARFWAILIVLVQIVLYAWWG